MEVPRSRLVVGLFGDHNNLLSDLFGLSCCQSVSGLNLVVNAGWYNGTDWLGWGSLGPGNILHIQSELNPGEHFVVLREEDAPATFKTLSEMSQDELHPGASYVASKAYIIVTAAQRYIVGPTYFDGQSRDHTEKGMTFFVLTREEAYELLALGKEPALLALNG